MAGARILSGRGRIVVPVPVSTYDHKPQMSAPELTDKLVEAIASGKYGLIVANYANPDMVGHTGVMQATIQAVDVDQYLGRLRAAIEAAGGIMLLTADHGNVELMKDPKTGEPHTARDLRCADHHWAWPRAPAWKTAPWPMWRRRTGDDGRLKSRNP